MNITREEVQKVLDALLYWQYKNNSDGKIHTECALYVNLIPLLQSKLAEKDFVEPVAYWDGGDYVSLSNGGDAKIPLFTHPTPKPMTEGK